jgi:ribosomal protein S18 acetylase RimI-like enzyme
VITEFFVLEEYRRQGIGRRLLEAAEAELSKRGITHFHLSTDESNAAALALYRSVGYELTSVMLEKDRAGL